MNLLRKNLNGGVKGSLAGLFIICLIYGVSVRVGTEQSFIQHCLTVITDHYYATYMMLPLLLLTFFFVIEDDSEVVILRYKTYFGHFIRKWMSLIAISMLFIAAQILAIFLSGIGLPPGNDWMIMEGSITQELFNVLSSIFDSPALSFMATSVFMLVGVCIISMILMWIGHFLSKSWATKVMLILYILSALSIKIGVLQELPITNFNHLLVLHHNFISPLRLIITVLQTVAIVIIILWTVKKCWYRRIYFIQGGTKGITPYYCKELLNRKNIVILCAVVMVMAVWKYLQSGGEVNGTEWIIRLFAGHGIGGLWALNFIEMLLLNGAPIYLLAAFIERVTTEHSIFVTVRLKKRRNIFSGILSSSLLFIAIYGIFLLLVPLTALMVMGLTPDSSVMGLLGQSVLLKLLDIISQFMFIMVLYCISKQITVGFISLIGINLLCTIPFNPLKYLPFGLSSLSRIHLPQTGEGSISFLGATVILLIASLVFTCWLFLDGYKRLPKS